MTTIPVIPVILVLSAFSPAEIHERVAARVAAEYARVGKPAPAADPILDRAAQLVAERALAEKLEEVADSDALAEALSESGGWEPIPRWFVVHANGPELALEAFFKRKDLSGEAATHRGLAVAARGDDTAIVVVLSERKVTLSEFPRRFEKAPAVQSLCGSLIPGLSDAEVLLTRPDGKVSRVALSRAQKQTFCAGLNFLTPGRYSIEVSAKSVRGSEVAARLFVDVQTPKPVAGREAHVQEPETIDDARLVLLGRINAPRAQNFVPPVGLDDRITEVAQAYSEQMAREHFLAQVGPDGVDLRSRVRNAGYLYRISAENIGEGSGPVAAHEAFEHNPGHRYNLLVEPFQDVGIGVAFDRSEGRLRAIVTEVLASPMSRTKDPVDDAYRALAWRRAEAKLPPLERSMVLESIAHDHARSGVPVHERAFRVIEDIRAATVEAFDTDSPEAVPASKALGDAGYTQVGIAAITLPPTIDGPKFRVVVVYAAVPDSHGSR